MGAPNEHDEAARAELARRLGEAGFALPGTLLERRPTCHKPTCRCMADPPRPHGPFFQWTRKVNNKTVTRRLSEEQMASYGSWFTNAKVLRELLDELRRSHFESLSTARTGELTLLARPALGQRGEIAAALLGGADDDSTGVVRVV